MLAVALAASCVSPQDKIDHPVRCHRRLMQVPVQSANGIEMGSKECVIVHYKSQRYVCRLY